MIVAHPPTDEPIIAGLCAALNRAVAAKFYVALDNAQGVSGFHAQGATLKSAKAEARAHLHRYSCWQRARVYDCERGIQTKLHTTLTNNKPTKAEYRCKNCGKPERVRFIGGVRYSNVSPRLRLCADCINAQIQP